MRIFTQKLFGPITLTHWLWLILLPASLHAIEISPGQTVKGTVGGGQTNNYTFNAEAGDAVRVLAVRTGGSASSVLGLTIVAPDGALLGADSRSEDAVAYLEAVRLTRSGVYEVRVWNTFSSQFFDYELGLIKTTGQNQVDSDGSGGVLAPGETKAGRIESPADIDTYTFTASANDTIKVLAVKTALSSGSVVGLQVMAPDGSVLGVDARGEDAVAYFDALRLPQSGSYQLVIWNIPFPGSLVLSQQFDYAVTLNKSSGNNRIDSDGSGGPILPGETKNGRIESPTDMDTYTFAASANDRIKVLAVKTALSSLAVVGLQVVAPNGAVLGLDARSEDAVAYFDSLQLPQSGTYQLVVWNIPFPGSLLVNQTFDYAVTFTQSPGSNQVDSDGSGGPILPGETKIGRIESPTDMDAYPFAAAAGDTIKVLAVMSTPSSGAVLGLQVVAPDGSVLGADARNEDAVAYFDALRLPQNGTYQLVIWNIPSSGSVVVNQTYDYVVSLLKMPGPNVGDPEGGQIGAEETKTGTISIGDLDAFEFDGLPCQNVEIRVSNRTSAAGPVTLELRASDGSILSSASGSAGASSRFYGLPKLGKYLITLRSTDGRKAFDYDLNLRLFPLPPRPQVGGGGPQLFITSCTNETVLFWPASAVGFSLESTLQLDSPILWLDVAGTSAIVGEWSIFSHPKLSAQEYFRLREKP